MAESVSEVSAITRTTLGEQAGWMRGSGANAELTSCVSDVTIGA